MDQVWDSACPKTEDLLTSNATATKGTHIKLDVWRLQQHVSLELPAGTITP